MTRCLAFALCLVTAAPLARSQVSVSISLSNAGGPAVSGPVNLSLSPSAMASVRFAGGGYSSTSNDPFINLPNNPQHSPSVGDLWSYGGKLMWGGTAVGSAGSGVAINPGSGNLFCLNLLATTCTSGSTSAASGNTGFLFDTRYQVLGGQQGNTGAVYFQGNTPGDTNNGGNVSLYGSNTGTASAGGVEVFSQGLRGISVDGNASGHTAGNVGIGLARFAAVPHPLTASNNSSDDVAGAFVGSNTADTAVQLANDTSKTWYFIVGGSASATPGVVSLYDQTDDSTPLTITAAGIHSKNGFSGTCNPGQQLVIVDGIVTNCVTP